MILLPLGLVGSPAGSAPCEEGACIDFLLLTLGGIKAGPPCLSCPFGLPISLRTNKGTTKAEDGLPLLIKSPPNFLLIQNVSCYTINKLGQRLVTGLEIGLHGGLPRPDLVQVGLVRILIP